MQLQARRATDAATNQLMREQLRAAGASESLVKLLTGEYRELALPAPTPDLGLGAKNPAANPKAVNLPPPAGATGATGATPANNQTASNQVNNSGKAAAGNQPNTQGNPNQGGAPKNAEPQGGEAGTHSTGLLAKFRNKAAVAFGIGAIAIAGLLGLGSRFRSSSEPSSKPSATGVITGKNAPPTGFNFKSTAPTNSLSDTNLPPIPSEASGATNAVTQPSTNTPPTSPTNIVQQAASSTNTVATASGADSSAKPSSTETDKTPDQKQETGSWYDSDRFNLFDGALSFLKPTRPPLAIPGTLTPHSAATNSPASESQAKTIKLRTDFSSMPFEELRDLVEKYQTEAIKATGEGKTSEVALEVAKGAARSDGNDPDALLLDYVNRNNGAKPAASATTTGSTNSTSTPSAKASTTDLQTDFSATPFKELRALVEKYQNVAKKARSEGKPTEEALKAAKDAAQSDHKDGDALLKEFLRRKDYPNLDIQELSTIFAPYFKYGEALTASGKTLEEAMQLTQAYAQSEGHDFKAMVAALTKKQSEAQAAQATASTGPSTQSQATAAAPAAAAAPAPATTTNGVATRTVVTREPLKAPVPNIHVTPKAERPPVVVPPVQASPRAKEAFPEMFKEQNPDGIPSFRSKDMKAAWALRDKYVEQARTSGAKEADVWGAAIGAAAKDGINLQATADKLAVASLGSGSSVRQAVKNADPAVAPQQAYRWVSEKSRSGERVAMVSGDGHVLGEKRITKFFGIPVWSRVVTPPGVTRQQFLQAATMHQPSAATKPS